MPVSGVMPMGIVLPARPSRVRWLPEVIFMLVVVCLLLLHGVRPASLVISSRYLWPWKRPLFLRSDLEATMVVENQLRRGSEVVWLDVFIWLWWSLVCRSSSFLAFLLHRLRGEEDGRKARWRDGFCRSEMSLFSPDFDAELRRSLFSSNRWAVSVDPATLRAEGQPCAGTASFARFVLPPGFKPSRRQFLFRLDAMAMSYGSLVAPSGPSAVATRRIPSGEDGPDRVSISQFEVLFVNAQGLACSFFFLLGLVVICVVLFFYE